MQVCDFSQFPRPAAWRDAAGLTARLLAFFALALAVCPDAPGEYVGYGLDVWSPVDTKYANSDAIWALAQRGDTVYLGGDFDYMGPDTGYGAVFDFDTGQVQPPFPRLDDEVYGCCGDGHGGRFVAGEFTWANCAFRQGLAHIQAGEALDTGWAPELFPGESAGWMLGPVAADANAVYVFARRKYSPDASVCAVDRLDGSRILWRASIEGRVTALDASVTLGRVYIAGDFTTVGGSAQPYLAALDAGDGALADWHPAPDAVAELLCVYEETVFVSGAFTAVGGESRGFLAALDGASGAATAWDPQADGAITAMTLGDGALYVAGAFEQIGGEYRTGLAALDLTTARARPFHATPGRYPNAELFAMAVHGDTLYLGGRFSSIVDANYYRWEQPLPWPRWTPPRAWPGRISCPWWKRRSILSTLRAAGSMSRAISRKPAGYT